MHDYLNTEATKLLPQRCQAAQLLLETKNWAISF